MSIDDADRSAFHHKPRGKLRRVHRPSPSKIARETGQRITETIDRPDGSRTTVYGPLQMEKEAAPASTDDNELDKWLLRHPEHARSPERH
jgi:hypothetical protein